MNKFTGKISNIVVAFFIGAIIVSFALTGFSGFNSSSNSVASVDGNPVTINEYNAALNSQIQRYTQMFGKDLTAQQIRQFRLKENTLNELITKKVMANYATSVGLESSEEEIKNSIKELPYFKTNEKFDVNKYKNLLKANNMNPSSFEDSFREDLATQKLFSLFNNQAVSDSYAKDVITFKNSGPMVFAVRFEKEKNSAQIKITNKELNDFIAKKENQSILKSVYNGMKSEFNKPAKVKASHILLRVSPDGSNEKEVAKKAKALRKKLNRRNFAKLANKNTEDPSGKTKGGDLGFFPKGQMVPAFDKIVFNMKNGQISQPVKTQFGYHIIYRKDFEKGVNKSLKDVEKTVAKRHLQKTKRKELQKINEKLTDEITAAMIAKNTKRLERLSKQYNFTFIKDKNLNFYDSNVGTIKFEFDKIAPLMDDKNLNKVYVQDEIVATKIVMGFSKASDKITELEDESKYNSQKDAMNKQLQSSLQNDLIKGLREKADIVSYPNML